jgi:hypothetical protein
MSDNPKTPEAEDKDDPPKKPKVGIAEDKLASMLVDPAPQA